MTLQCLVHESDITQFDKTPSLHFGRQDHIGRCIHRHCHRSYNHFLSLISGPIKKDFAGANITNPLPCQIILNDFVSDNTSLKQII